mmetsp:Transcript_37631/g.70324  ORF Transcript_37631/g.70324 Transcript_37631/m.70324 type:complete len:211 (+) Transcript_37631:78-710(+)
MMCISPLPVPPVSIGSASHFLPLALAFALAFALALALAFVLAFAAALAFPAAAFVFAAAAFAFPFGAAFAFFFGAAFALRAFCSRCQRTSLVPYKGSSNSLSLALSSATPLSGPSGASSTAETGLPTSSSSSSTETRLPTSSSTSSSISFPCSSLATSLPNLRSCLICSAWCGKPFTCCGPICSISSSSKESNISTMLNISTVPSSHKTR